MEETNSPPPDPGGPPAISALTALPSGVAALAGPGLAACALAAPASGPAARPLGVAAPAGCGLAAPPSGVAATAASGLQETFLQMNAYYLHQVPVKMVK